MRPGLGDCLSRGIASLRANWELVIVHWLQGIVVFALVATGALLPLVVIGVGALGALPTSGTEIGPWIERVADSTRGLAGALFLAGLGTLVVWLLAALVYSFFAAGVMGVLHNADRQAPPGPARDWRSFRTFSLRDLAGWGGLYIWRYFGFGLLSALLCTVLLTLLVGVWVLAGVWGARRWGAGAAFGIGCGGALPIAFVVAALALWATLALADLAREGSGVWTACRQAVRVLGGRLGTVLLIALLFVAVTALLGFVTLPVSLAARLALHDELFAGLAVRGLLAVVEGLLGSTLSVALLASLVALMRGESPAAGAAA
jgi:hypothetical protein